MKFEVIGWTEYDNTAYPPHYGDGGAVSRAIAAEIRNKGYRFGGNYHQEGETGAPVLSDGTIVRYSMRTWGAVMADAWNVDNSDGMAYMEWYMDNVEELVDGTPRKTVTPPDFVDVLRIRPRAALAETFRMHLIPEAFEAVKSGKKTVELRLNNKDRHYICKDDFIVFEGPEGETLKVQALSVHYFESFERMMGKLEEGLEFLRDEEEDERNAALAARALFGECDTPEKLLAFLEKTYPKKERDTYYAMAIEIRRIEE